MTVGYRIRHKLTIQYAQNMQNIQHKYHKDFIRSIMVILKHKKFSYDVKGVYI